MIFVIERSCEQLNLIRYEIAILNGFKGRISLQAIHISHLSECLVEISHDLEILGSPSSQLLELCLHIFLIADYYLTMTLEMCVWGLH